MTENEREVTDADGTTWSCVLAYAGVGEGMAAQALEERRAAEGRGVPVVCTPSGGAQSIRLELAHDWMQSLSDEALLEAIQSRRT